MKGRKPKPTHLKLVAGNPGKRAMNPDEPKPVATVPMPPRELSDDAKVEWGRVASDLAALGVMTAIDRGALAAYCQAFGRWVQAERAITEMAAEDTLTGGLLIKTTNGNAIQNPLVGIANKAMSDMVRFAAEFGMTPSSRSRVRANGEGQKQTDPAAQYFA